MSCSCPTRKGGEKTVVVEKHKRRAPKPCKK